MRVIMPDHHMTFCCVMRSLKRFGIEYQYSRYEWSMTWSVPFLNSSPRFVCVFFDVLGFVARVCARIVWCVNIRVRYEICKRSAPQREGDTCEDSSEIREATKTFTHPRSFARMKVWEDEEGRGLYVVNTLGSLAASNKPYMPPAGLLLYLFGVYLSDIGVGVAV